MLRLLFVTYFYMLLLFFRYAALSFCHLVRKLSLLDFYGLCRVSSWVAHCDAHDEFNALAYPPSVSGEAFVERFALWRAF